MKNLMARGKAILTCRAQPIPGDSAAYGVGPGLELAADRQRQSMNGKMEEKPVEAAAVPQSWWLGRLSGPQLGKLSQLRPEASGLLLPL